MSAAVPLSDDLSLERRAFDASRDDFDLFRAACLLPRIEGRAPHVQHCVETVEQWASLLRKRIGPDAPLSEQYDAIARLLFVEKKLHGNEDEYDAPYNSFVADALDRRTGLPITLSLITWAVATAAGLRPMLLAQPRHFLVALTDASRVLIFDPFRRGARFVPRSPEETESLSEPDPVDVLARMLVNLRGAYVNRLDHAALEAVLSRLLILYPRTPELLVERAQARFFSGEFAGAHNDLETALSLRPDDDTRQAAEETMKRMAEHMRELN